MSTATRSQPILLTRATGTTPAVRTPTRVERSKPSDKNADNPAAMVLTYLRLHWLAILFCGSLLGACLAYAAWTLIPEKYESYSLLQVASSPTVIGSKGDGTEAGTQFATYLKTQKQLITSDFVLDSALRDEAYRISQTATIEAEENPIRFLKENLEISTTEGSEILRISMIGKHPEDVRRIVNAVKDAFYREVVEREKAQKSIERTAMQTAKNRFEEAMKQQPGIAPVESSPTVTATDNPPTTLPNLPEMGGQSVIQAMNMVPTQAVESAIVQSPAYQKFRYTTLLGEMGNLSAEIKRAPLAIGKQQQRIAMLEKQLETEPSETPGLLEALERDPEVFAKTSEAERERRKYDLKRRRVNVPNSPEMNAQLARVQALEAEVETLKQSKAREYEEARRLHGENTLVNQLAEAKNALVDLEAQDKLNRKLLEDAQQEFSTLPPEQQIVEKEGPLVDPQKTVLLTHDDIYKLMVAQLIKFDLELQSPDRIQVLQAASVPSPLDPKKRYMGTAIAGLLGIGLIGLIFIGNEMRLRKLSSLNELKTLGPTSIVGVLPWLPDGSASRDPLKRADVHESIDKLRSYVAQSWINRGATTIAVTSPHADEGKAFTAFSLANSLNLAGYRTLLIDFDPRTPMLHRYANVANDEGVCELLRGEADPRDSVMILPSGLHFLPAGKWSDEARQAAVGGRIEGLLARLRGPFDCVVLHANSLLTMAESVEIARLSEVVLLCSLYRETRVPLLKRATERLATMEVPYTGIVYLGASSQEALC